MMGGSVGLTCPTALAITPFACRTNPSPSNTTFPNTQNVLKGLFEGVPADEVEMMTHRNAEELFRFPMTPEGFNFPELPAACRRQGP